MEIHEIIPHIQSKEDLIRFIFELRSDLDINKENWENPSLDRYLEAMEAWLTDTNEEFSQPSWKLFADILYASKIYE